MKFVMTQAITDKVFSKVENFSEVYVADNSDPNNYLDEMQDADALIVRIASCDGNVINNSPNLKVIGKTGVGFDAIDVKTATEKGIPVVITPGANNRSVAEHTIAFILSISKNLYEAQEEMYRGNWEIRSANKAYEIKNKNVGIIGLGAIGKEVAKMVKGLGMKALGYDPLLSEEQITELGIEGYENLDKLLSESDFVTVHVPLIEETKNMIAKEQISVMKKTAAIINTARGGIVNENDLAQALADGKIAAAAIDAFTEEPPSMESNIIQAPNLIASPHSAAQTREAVINMANMCVDGCLAVIEGKKWPYVADLKVYDHPKWSDAQWAEVD